MSYAKAMKHSRNIRKQRKQANMFFGFDTGSGRWPSGWANPAIRPLLEIRQWFPTRNDGTPEQRQNTRDCLREAIKTLRTVRD